MNVTKDGFKDRQLHNNETQDIAIGTLKDYQRYMKE